MSNQSNQTRKSKKNTNNNNNNNKKNNSIVEKRKKNNRMNNPKQNNSKNQGRNDTVMNNAKKYGMYRSLVMSDPAIGAFQNVYEHPWSKQSARIPSFPVSESQLTRVRVWSNGVCNSAGIGFVVATVSNSVANDLPAVAISTGPGAPNYISAAGTDITQVTSDSEYDSSKFTNIDQKDGWDVIRPVAAGLRIKYIGTTLNKSGLCYAIQNSPRALALDGFAVNEIVKRPHKTYNFSNYGWHGVTRHINDTDDFLYQQYSENQQWNYETDTTSQITLDDYWNLAMLVVADPGAPFEVEYVAHFEIKGKNLHRTAVSRSNTAGLEQVVNKSTSVRHLDNTTPDYAPVQKLSSQTQESKPSYLGDILGGLGEGILGALF